MEETDHVGCGASWGVGQVTAGSPYIWPVQKPRSVCGDRVEAPLETRAGKPTKVKGGLPFVAAAWSSMRHLQDTPPALTPKGREWKERVSWPEGHCLSLLTLCQARPPGPQGYFLSPEQSEASPECSVCRGWFWGAGSPLFGPPELLMMSVESFWGWCLAEKPRHMGREWGLHLQWPPPLPSNPSSSAFTELRSRPQADGSWSVWPSSVQAGGCPKGPGEPWKSWSRGGGLEVPFSKPESTS